MTATEDTGIEVRTVTEAELVDYRRAERLGFGVAETVDDERAARIESEPLERARAAVANGKIVATLRSFPTELTVPGGVQLRAGAVTWVTCHASHRRRGLLTRMMTQDLHESRERGEIASVLIASEYPIYGRFGFGPAADSTSWELDTSRARFASPGEGTVEYVGNAEFRTEAPGVFERVRQQQAGMIGRTDLVWDKYADLYRSPEDKPWVGFRVLCRDADGVAQGWASYTQPKEWSLVSTATVNVADMCAATPAAHVRLLRFIAELDLVGRATFVDRPADELLPHLLTDARAAQRTYQNDFLWVRLLDVATALQARTYQRAGEVVVEVVDDLAGGRFLLEAGPDGATCTPTTRTPDLTLPVRTLGAAYLGGYRLEQLARAGWADGDAGTLGALLATAQAPWCNTWF